MSIELSAGAVPQMYRNESPEQPTLQVLNIKLLQANQPNSQKRYRLIISDGKHYQQAMLATQLNDLIENDTLKKFGVFRLTEYLVNSVHSRRIVIILKLDVVPMDPHPEGVLGAPANIDTDPEAQQSGGASAAAPMAASAAAPMSAAQPSVQAKTEAPSSSSSMLPVAPSYSAAPAASMGFDDLAPIVPVANINPYLARFSIRVRVSAKNDIRTWSNQRGDGKLFSMDLLDKDKTEIRATAFNAEVDKFYKLIEVGSVYVMSKFQVKAANKKFTSIPHEYELTFRSDTEVRLVQADEVSEAIPIANYAFESIAALEDKPADALVDTIGVLTKVGDVTSITARSTGNQMSKRDVVIADTSGRSITLTLWHARAEQFEGEPGRVLVVKGAKISDFSGKSLNSVSSSQIKLDVDIPETHQLLGWWSAEGQNASLTTLSAGGPGGAGGRGPRERRMIADIKLHGLGMKDAPDYYDIRGTVSFIRHERNISYPACPNDKKKMQESEGGWYCENCQQRFDAPDHRYILSLSVGDASGSTWVSAFNDQGIQLMQGITANQLVEWGNESPEFDSAFTNATFRKYVMTVRSKNETYNDQQSVKTTIVAMEPLDYIKESKWLLERLQQYSNKPVPC